MIFRLMKFSREREREREREVTAYVSLQRKAVHHIRFSGW